MIVLLIVTDICVGSKSCQVRADGNVYVENYGSQLVNGDNEQNSIIYNKLIEKYIYGKNDEGNADGSLTGLAKPVGTERSIILTENLKQQFNSKEDLNTYLQAWIVEKRDTYMSGTKNAFQAFYKDYPEAFWMNGVNINISFKNLVKDLGSGKCAIDAEMDVYVTPVECFKGAMSYIGEFNKAVLETRAAIQKEYDIEKSSSIQYVAKAIHDYVAKRISYDSDAAANTENSSYAYAHTALPGFVDGAQWSRKAVCDGYAKSFMILCNQFGLKTMLISGYGVNQSGVRQAHTWNAIVGDDGKWYVVDATWDSQNGEARSDYFMVGENSKGFYNTVGKEHIASGVLSADAKFQFKLPEISKNGIASEGEKNSNDVNNSGNNNSSSNDNIEKNIPSHIVASDVIVKTNNGSTGKQYVQKEVTVKTTKISIKKVKAGKIKAQKYKGRAVKPTVKLKYNGKLLKKNKDYTVSYKKNKKKGTAQIIVKGKGDFEGKKIIKFKIK